MATTFDPAVVVDNKYPPGTTVGVYPFTNWPAHLRDNPPAGAPPGSATDTSVVAADSTIPQFTGLTQGVRYWMAASVASVWYYGPAFTVLP